MGEAGLTCYLSSDKHKKTVKVVQNTYFKVLNKRPRQVTASGDGTSSNSKVAKFTGTSNPDPSTVVEY